MATAQTMSIKKALLVLAVLAAISTGTLLLPHLTPPAADSQQHSLIFGDITVARPLWGSQGLVLAFVDTQKFPPQALAQRMAATALTAAIIDTGQVFKGISAGGKACLDGSVIATAFDALRTELPDPAGDKLIVTGIGSGALVPFLNALSPPGNAASNISIDFSVNIPADWVLCPPLSTLRDDQQQRLTAAPAAKGHWRSVWTDQPTDNTAVFIRSLGDVDTRIAPYDTPLDKLLIEEVESAIGQSNQAAPPMPVVEVPSTKPSDTVTLFYSGDGGWRDLDRSVADEMAAQNYPVVGVDVLRYFWEHKTPEQAAADLAATMAYYRKHWGVKSFVLAGYSFGADILPPIYNRLSTQDQNSVALLVLLALADRADFEIHVSGWLGQSDGEHALAPELIKLPKQKILCVYGKDEKAETACTALANSEADILELPGGHHFDQDYPKLTRRILDVYRQHGIQ